MNNLVNCVGFEVIMAVVMNVAIFWYIAACSPYINLLHAGFLFGSF
jgi:hypothetical protein